jgi:hypothetical protein
MTPIVICTVNTKCLKVLELSIKEYAPDVKVFIFKDKTTTFGEAYNNAMTKVFETYDEVIIANDDIVLTPTSYNLLMEDVEYLKTTGVKLGFVASRADEVRQLQQGKLNQIQEVACVSPLFAYISKEAFEFAQFPPINYWSDDVICLDLIKEGYNNFISRSYVHHVGSQTVGINIDKFIKEDKPWIVENRPEYCNYLFGEKKLRKVIIGTPSYDGTVDVHYTNSLIESIKLAPKYNVELFPIFMAYDALIQRARNDLVKIAIESDCDDIIFIDSDQEWNPEWLFQLLNRQVDVVGGTVVKKSEDLQFNIKMLSEGLVLNENGLMEVECVGTGFMKISKNALKKIWDISPEYKNSDKVNRMVFDIQIIDGNLVSEDNIFCMKWRKMGGKIWIDPTMTCNHIGFKKYTGSFLEYIQRK